MLGCRSVWSRQISGGYDDPNEWLGRCPQTNSKHEATSQQRKTVSFKHQPSLQATNSASGSRRSLDFFRQLTGSQPPAGSSRLTNSQLILAGDSRSTQQIASNNKQPIGVQGRAVSLDQLILSQQASNLFDPSIIPTQKSAPINCISVDLDLLKLDSPGNSHSERSSVTSTDSLSCVSDLEPLTNPIPTLGEFEILFNPIRDHLIGECRRKQQNEPVDQLSNRFKPHLTSLATMCHQLQCQTVASSCDLGAKFRRTKRLVNSISHGLEDRKSSCPVSSMQQLITQLLNSLDATVHANATLLFPSTSPNPSDPPNASYDIQSSSIAHRPVDKSNSTVGSISTPKSPTPQTIDDALVCEMKQLCQSVKNSIVDFSTLLDVILTPVGGGGDQSNLPHQPLTVDQLMTKLNELLRVSANLLSVIGSLTSRKRQIPTAPSLVKELELDAKRLCESLKGLVCRGKEAVKSIKVSSAKSPRSSKCQGGIMSATMLILQRLYGACSNVDHCLVKVEQTIDRLN